jgi:hypothetical protein
MAIILVPFQILGVPAKWILGMIGVFIAACVNAIIFRQLLCWCAWNFGWTSVGTGTLAITMIGSFILTFVGVNDK